MIIDFHVHLTEYNSYTQSILDLYEQLFPDPKKREEFFAFYADPANYAALLRHNKVDYACILAEYSPLTTGIATNRKVAEFCKDHDELLPFANINPYEVVDLRGCLRSLVLDHGFRGLKLYPTYQHFYPNEPKLYPLYETAQELEIPILFHTGTSVFKNARLKYGNPVLYDDVAVDFPELNIVLAHSGRTGWYNEAMMVARLHRNLYLELSGLAVKRLLEFFPEMERYAHKFIFGTDWPQVEYPDIFARYQGLKLKQEALNAIMGDNAAKILKLM